MTKASETYKLIEPFLKKDFASLFQKSSGKGSGKDRDYFIDLYDMSDEVIRSYSVSEAGLTGANGAAASGDVILIPNAIISGDYTITAGVAMVGISRSKTILTGSITGADEACIERLSIIRTANDANELIGIVGQASGTFYVKDCDVIVTQSGAGLAAGLKQASAGLVAVWNSLLQGISTGGDGYGSYRTSGAILIDGGATLGSTAAIYDP